MSPIRIANAPVSWGALEFEGFKQKPLPYDVVLDEIAETGYAGTELGDWGFMPDRSGGVAGGARPARAGAAGRVRPGAAARSRRAGSRDRARAARGPAAGGGRARTATARKGPFIVVADDNATDPVRTLQRRPHHPGDGAARRGVGGLRRPRRSGRPRRAGGNRAALGLPSPFRGLGGDAGRNRSLPGRNRSGGASASSSIPGTTSSARARGARRWSRRSTAGAIASGTSISRTTTASWPAARAKKDGTTSQAIRAGIFSELGKGERRLSRPWCAGSRTTATTAGPSSSRTFCPAWARPKRARGAIASTWRRLGL